MASASFRESMNSLGWSRRASDLPVNTSQQTGLLSSLRSLNPFGESGYVRLPTTEGAGAPLPAASRREEEEGWFACSVLFLASWAAMMGPWTYFQHLTSTPRLPFTATYFGSIALTLYFSLGLGFDAYLLRDPTGMSDMVSGQLLPYGLQRLAPGNQFWSAQGSGLDVWLIPGIWYLADLVAFPSHLQLYPVLYE
ncbi:hypothetical protein DH86_00003358 [Scytalidium sp. 3C]|nr:hypothetical protein DH86_00003358 [Scytalidium sp. 3C]